MNQMNPMQNYIPVAQRIQMARKKLPASEGWCFKAFPQIVVENAGYSIHVGQILKAGVLCCQNIAVMHLPDPSFLYHADSVSPDSPLYKDAVNATLAKGNTVALGRTLVLAGFPVSADDDADALLQVAGLAEGRELIEMRGFNGEMRKFEPTMSRLHRFRKEYDVKSGWGIIVDAIECDPGSEYKFQASIIHVDHGDEDGLELAQGTQMWTNGADRRGFIWKEAESLATQAVGRALAYMGFIAEDTEMASVDEMISVHNLAYQGKNQNDDDVSENETGEIKSQIAHGLAGVKVVG